MKSAHEYTILLFSALFCSHVSVFTLELAAEDGLSAQWTVTLQWASLFFFESGGALRIGLKGGSFSAPIVFNLTQLICKTTIQTFPSHTVIRPKIKFICEVCKENTKARRNISTRLPSPVRHIFENRHRDTNHRYFMTGKVGE